MSKLFSILGIGLMLMSAGVVRAEDQKDASDNGKAQVGGTLTIGSGAPGEGIILQLGGNGDAKLVRPKLGDYWLGVAVQPLGEDARKELKIEGGLVVEQVLPDGPAAKAGIKMQDIVVKAGDKDLKSPGDLIDVVNEAKDKAIKLEVTRDGKGLTMEVTPEERPELPMRALMPQADGQQIREWMEKIEKDLGEGKAGGPLRFHVFRPGAILPQDVLPHRGLPDDMTVVVTRTGKKPAKVVVEQGDKRWEATEDKLGELPKEVRPHVEGMLGRPSIFGMTEGVRVFESPAEGARPALNAERPAQRFENRVERRLEEMSQRLDKLNKAIDDMRAARPQRKAKTVEKSEVQQPQETQPNAEK